MYTQFVVGSADVVTTPLKRNGLKLPAPLMHIKTTNSCQLKLSTDMLTKSRAACDVRKNAAKQVFSYEFTCVPECLVDKLRNAYHSNNADIIKIAAPKLDDASLQEPLTFEGLVVDISAIIRSEASVITATNYTYAQFAHYVLRRVEIMASSSHA